VTSCRRTILNLVTGAIIPVAMPPHAQMFSRRQSADRLDHRQPGAHRPLGEVRT
jgi:hypothetical protein